MPTKQTEKPQIPAKSLSRVIREIVIGDANLNADNIAERCKKAGHIMVKRSTISTLRADCLATLSAARAMGWQEPQAIVEKAPKKAKAKKPAAEMVEAPAVEPMEALAEPALEPAPETQSEQEQPPAE